MISVKEAQNLGSMMREDEKEIAAKVEEEIDKQIRDRMDPYTYEIVIVIPSTTPVRAQIFLKQRYQEGGWYISSQSTHGKDIRWTFCTSAPTYGDRD